MYCAVGEWSRRISIPACQRAQMEDHRWRSPDGSRKSGTTERTVNTRSWRTTLYTAQISSALGHAYSGLSMPVGLTSGSWVSLPGCHQHLAHHTLHIADEYRISNMASPCRPIATESLCCLVVLTHGSCFEGIDRLSRLLLPSCLAYLYRPWTVVHYYQTTNMAGHAMIARLPFPSQPFPSVVRPVQAAMSNEGHGRSPINVVQERHEAGGHVGFILEPVLSICR